MKDDKRLKRKVRNSYIVSNISIALVLFLLGSVGYLMTAAMQVARTLQESVTVTVELRNGADEKQKESLRKRFEANELVSHVEYSSKDDKLNDTDFRQMFEQEFEAILEENPLLDSLILVSNTIRLAIFSKRYLINTMKLVGATKWFIMRPFLGSSITQGILSGIIASALFLTAVYGLNEAVPELMSLAETMKIGIIVGGMVLGGILISLCFTFFAVNKFVNMKSNKIYLY